MSLSVDVLVVGGGMVGATLARAMSDLSISFLVVDAAPPAGQSKGSAFDRRVTALANGSQRILDAIGLWQHLEADVQPIKTIHISDQGGFGFARLRAEEEGVRALGYTIENTSLGTCLLKHRSLAAGQQWWSPARLDDINVHDSHVSATIVDEQDREHIVEARLVVAADGSSSRVRTLLGLETVRHRYDQTAVVLNIAMSQRHLGRAFERFTRHGPLALLPLVRETDGCGLDPFIGSGRTGPSIGR